jgi:NitT/TauT family transport system permease protein
MKKIRLFIYRFLPLIVFLALWEYVISPVGKNEFLFSKPSKIFKSLYENIANGILVNDFLITSYETIVGFLLGSFTGVSFGFLLWYSKRVAYISKPYIVALGSIPIFALAPMTIIWFGTGLFAKIMMSALSVFAVAVVQAFNGASNVDEQQITLLKSFGAHRFTIFKKVVLPSSLIWVLSSFKINIGFALLGAFIGEFISAERGLGYRMIKSAGLYNTSLLLAALLLLIVLAFILNWLVQYLEKKLIYWK